MASAEQPHSEAPNPQMMAMMALQEFFKLYNPLRNNDEFIPLAKFRGYWLPTWLPLLWPQIRNFPIRNDDITIVGFPKSGNHWLLYIVYLVETGDFEGYVDRDQRMLLEIPRPPFPSALESLGAIPKQRFLMTHLPASLLPRDVFNGRLIYIYRNAKDTAVSYYYHQLAMSNENWPFKSSFEEFARTFMTGKFLAGPYPEHVKEYAELREQKKPILFLRYEDLKKDHKAVIRQIAEFLGKTLDDATVEKIRDLSSFKSMQDNNDVNWKEAKQFGIWKKEIDFLRKGKIGDWRSHFEDPNLLASFDKFIADNMPAELIPPSDEDI